MSIIKIVKDFEIPYIGGYSSDGNTIYICRSYPDSFVDLSGRVHMIHTPLIVHEQVEVGLMRALSFEDAHKRALEYEISLLNSLDIPVDEYYGFLYKYVRKNMRKVKAGHHFDIPHNLDMRPYLSDNINFKKK